MIKISGHIKYEPIDGITDEENKAAVLANVNGPYGDIQLEVKEDNEMRWGEYLDFAVRTEGTDFPVYLNRANETGVRNLMFFELKEFLLMCKELDKVKKYIFYGKPADLVVAPSSGLLIADKLEVRLLHSLLGMITEVGELVEKYIKMISDTTAIPIDLESWNKEFGDVCWYLALGVQALGLKDVLEMNIEKLRKRYPDKFTEELARIHKGD